MSAERERLVRAVEKAEQAARALRRTHRTMESVADRKIDRAMDALAAHDARARTEREGT